MSDTLQYKGYNGTVEYSAEDKVLFGLIVAIRDTITYEATSVKGLEKAFREAVDDYLETCREIGKSPDQPFKGSFNVRIKPDVHRQAVIRASNLDISLNRFIESVIEKEVLKPLKPTRR